MSILLSWVLSVHDEFVVRSWPVILLAVGIGMDVNRETTSKDIKVSSGSILRSFMWWRNVLAFVTE